MSSSNSGFIKTALIPLPPLSKEKFAVRAFQRSGKSANGRPCISVAPYIWADAVLQIQPTMDPFRLSSSDGRRLASDPHHASAVVPGWVFSHYALHSALALTGVAGRNWTFAIKIAYSGSAASGSMVDERAGGGYPNWRIPPAESLCQCQLCAKSTPAWLPQGRKSGFDAGRYPQLTCLSAKYGAGLTRARLYRKVRKRRQNLAFMARHRRRFGNLCVGKFARPSHLTIAALVN